MSGTTAATMRAAQRVQTLSTASLVAVAIGWASLQVFDVAYGSDLGAEPRTDTAAVARLVADRTADGLSCREKPAFTDDVIFSYESDGEPAGAAVLTFDQAIAAQKDGAGSIARYCL